MIKLPALIIFTLFAMSMAAFADGTTLSCDRGSLRERVKCLSTAVDKLSLQVRELSGQLSDRPTRSEVAEMIKAATDQATKGNLRYGATVSFRSVARPDRCIDKRSQDDTTIQAWECNNNENHRLQHWTITEPIP